MAGIYEQDRNQKIYKLNTILIFMTLANKLTSIILMLIGLGCIFALRTAKDYISIIFLISGIILFLGVGSYLLFSKEKEDSKK